MPRWPHRRWFPKRWDSVIRHWTLLIKNAMWRFKKTARLSLISWIMTAPDKLFTRKSLMTRWLSATPPLMKTATPPFKRATVCKRSPKNTRVLLTNQRAKPLISIRAALNFRIICTKRIHASARSTRTANGAITLMRTKLCSALRKMTSANTKHKCRWRKCARWWAKNNISRP